MKLWGTGPFDHAQVAENDHLWSPRLHRVDAARDPSRPLYPEPRARTSASSWASSSTTCALPDRRATQAALFCPSMFVEACSCLA